MQKRSKLGTARYHGQLSSCTMSDKTENPILRKSSDRQAGRQADRQTYRQTDRETDRLTDRRTRVISQDAVWLTSSVQHEVFK